jgi:acyl-lipid omega-6 desaturase (Delta-12 desaturase)
VSHPDIRQVVAPYARPDTGRAFMQLFVTLVPLAFLMWLSHVGAAWSLAVPLLLAFPIAGLLVRTFVLMHDCSHGSLFPSREWNDGVGFVTGLITFTAFSQWRRDHALHHASSGDLDRRGHGDVPTLTVREYLSRGRWGRLGYRVVRHPLLLLLGGPFQLVLSQRFRRRSTATGATQQWSVLLTNVAIVASITIAVLLVGWQTVILAYLLPFYMAAMAGVWLFYVQHQFEDAYWAAGNDWDYVEAALRGSSHLKMPAILNWFTGDIGLHHVHHVAPRIPNHRLRECHRDNPVFHSSPVVTIRSGMSALRLALWDESRQRLISFRDLQSSQGTECQNFYWKSTTGLTGPSSASSA